VVHYDVRYDGTLVVSYPRGLVPLLLCGPLPTSISLIFFHIPCQCACTLISLSFHPRHHYSISVLAVGSLQVDSAPEVFLALGLFYFDKMTSTIYMRQETTDASRLARGGLMRCPDVCRTPVCRLRPDIGAADAPNLRARAILMLQGALFYLSIYIASLDTCAREFPNITHHIRAHRDGDVLLDLFSSGHWHWQIRSWTLLEI